MKVLKRYDADKFIENLTSLRLMITCAIEPTTTISTTQGPKSAMTVNIAAQVSSELSRLAKLLNTFCEPRENC